jgi:hypothetical protein
MVVAALISVTGGTAFSRSAENEMQVLLGVGPTREQPQAGEGLTGLGVFLFVSLPLFIAGGVLYGSS